MLLSFFTGYTPAGDPMMMKKTNTRTTTYLLATAFVFGAIAFQAHAHKKTLAVDEYTMSEPFSSSPLITYSSKIARSDI